MLIKIDEDGTFINSDHIVVIGTPTVTDWPIGTIRPAPLKEGYKRLWLIDGLTRDIPDAVANYIAQILDANDAFTSEAPAAMSLASRIAIFLRNRSDGASLSFLCAEFFNVETQQIRATLNELDANNTVRALGVDENTRLYYHASNPIFGVPDEEF